MSRQASVALYTSAATKPTRAKAAPSIATGKRLVVKVKAPVEGRVHRVTVYQESGTDVDFTIELLASSIPYGDGTVLTTDYNAALTAPADAYRVIPQQTETAGNTLDWRSQETAGGAEGVPFVNMDQAGKTEAQPYIYLAIIPTNSVDTSTWCVTIVFDQPTSF